MTDPGVTEIGKYKIIGVLGEGAMGLVYRATDSVIGRTVAVKVMSESIARDGELRKRFMHEAQAAGSMQHPNIVSLYDLGEVGGHLYIVMEFVEGVDLAYLISSRKPLTLQTKLDIIIDVLAGLSYAHKRGIVHRDIKPANIRIAEDGRAKIMDFGVAHLSSSELTVTGSVVGTPAYMAPEQITGSRTTSATDLFAVGAVLYELVTGAKAFQAPTIQSLYFKIVSEPPVPIVEILPGLPPELNRIIVKALEKEPSNRYATAMEMANDLTQLRATLSDAATRPSTMSLTATVARALSDEKPRETNRNRQLAIGGGALALVVIAAVVFAMTRRNQTENAAAPVTTIAADSPKTIAAEPPAAPPLETQTTNVVPPPSGPVAKKEKRSPPPPPPPPLARAKKSEPPVVRPQPAPTAPVVTRVAPQPQPQAPLPPPPPPPPAPAVAPSTVQPSPQPAPSAPAPSAAGARAVIQDYERAIEQRDVGAIRSVYPNLTSSEQSNWENFFRAARRVKVALQVRSLEVNGNSAQARLAGTYDYEDSSGRPQPTIRVSANVSLRHDGNAWHIVSVRSD